MSVVVGGKVFFLRFGERAMEPEVGICHRKRLTICKLPASASALSNEHARLNMCYCNPLHILHGEY